MGGIYPLVLEGKLYVGQGRVVCFLPGKIYFADEVVLQHVGNVEQSFDVDALAVEDGVEGGACAVYLTGELGIAHPSLIHFLLDDATDVYVLELGIHSLSLLRVPAPVPLWWAFRQTKSVRNSILLIEYVVSPNTRLSK